MRFLKFYKSSVVLLGCVILGGIVGIVFGPKAIILQPFGNLFLNLMFMIIVPLVFFSISSAIANMKSMNRLGKIMASVFFVFVCTSVVIAVIGFIGALIMSPTKGIDTATIQSILTKAGDAPKLDQVTPMQQLVNTFTVPDFVDLFSKKNMLQIIVFAVFFGVSTVMVGEKAKPVVNLLDAVTSVIVKVVDIIMYYAPIGLFCYFASVIGQLGGQIIGGYLRVFILYIIIAVVYYFGFFTLYAFISGGKKNVKIFWKNAIKPSVAALATCSSAACIPINLEYTQKMGVPKDISETVIPLGANMHKDGSVLGGVMKITFLFGIFGRSITTPSAIISIIFISILVGAVMAAIPSGGMIGEMLILSIYGFPPSLLPVIAVISTIIDAPATLLNSTGNTVTAMMITRLVEGKS